ncbi:hypothetical protein [Nocardioides mangrovi]|uniref:Uncharacterized protein n=1 Tax=Nocardioides mangrovi TaxID=2874580 RepID=A0ABS7U7I9_9ACTN|nr:hypothetical protein [Nocardioides mangrovi]MBZ5736953.1 hypothetical protein [Nocardioides mangrovi]
MTHTPTRPAPNGGQSPGPSRPTRDWTVARVVATVAASVFLLVGSGLLLTGTGVALVSTALRGSDGYYSTTPATWSSDGAAVRSEAVRMHGAMMPGMPQRMDRMVGRVVVTVQGSAGAEVFVGLARTADVDRYLTGVPCTTMHDPWDGDDRYADFVPGTVSPGPPEGQTFWVASSSGRGTQTMRWDADTGDWTLVVMNADGSSPVRAEVTIAARMPVLSTVGAVLIVSGLVVIGAAGTGLWFAVARSTTNAPLPEEQS